MSATRIPDALQYFKLGELLSHKWQPSMENEQRPYDAGPAGGFNGKASPRYRPSICSARTVLGPEQQEEQDSDPPRMERGVYWG